MISLNPPSSSWNTKQSTPLLLGILLKIRACKRLSKDLEENQGYKKTPITTGVREDRENMTDTLLVYVLGYFRNIACHFSTK